MRKNIRLWRVTMSPVAMIWKIVSNATSYNPIHMLIVHYLAIMCVCRKFMCVPLCVFNS